MKEGLDDPGLQRKGVKQTAMKGLGDPSSQKKGDWQTVKKSLDGPSSQKKGANDRNAYACDTRRIRQKAIKLAALIGKIVIIRILVIYLRKALSYVFCSV